VTNYGDKLLAAKAELGHKLDSANALLGGVFYVCFAYQKGFIAGKEMGDYKIFNI